MNSTNSLIEKSGIINFVLGADMTKNCTARQMTAFAVLNTKNIDGTIFISI